MFSHGQWFKLLGPYTAVAALQTIALVVWQLGLPISELIGWVAVLPLIAVPVAAVPKVLATISPKRRAAGCFIAALVLLSPLIAVLEFPPTVFLLTMLFFSLLAWLGLDRIAHQPAASRVLVVIGLLHTLTAIALVLSSLIAESMQDQVLDGITGSFILAAAMIEAIVGLTLLVTSTLLHSLSAMEQRRA